MITLGNNEVTKAFLGSTEVKKICLGSEQVWPVVLPYDEEVSYLASNSEAYIDTGISGNNNNLEFTIKFLFTTFDAYGGIYGNFVEGGTNCYRLTLGSSSGDGLVNINSAAGSSGNNSISVSPNISYSISVKRNSITINGKSYSPSNLASGTANNDNIALFNRSVTNPNTTRNIGLRICSCQIRDNGVLVRDFIPVRVGQVGYMYDKISGHLFGNVGTGAFTFGLTPYDAEIEYLESSGTQYIQLICNAPKGSFFAVGGVVTPIYKNTNGYAIFGANPYQQFLSTFYSRNSSSVITYASHVGASATSGGWGGIEGNELSFELSTAGKTTNETFKALSRPLTANITAFRIFGGYQNNNRYPIKIKSFYIISGNTKLYDLIAVRIGQVGYMYDKISGELFGNSGTGSFTLGPDVS